MEKNYLIRRMELLSRARRLVHNPIAKKLGWRVNHARDFAVALLIEVNDHQTASELLDIIERKK